LFGTTMPPWLAPMLRRDLLPQSVARGGRDARVMLACRGGKTAWLKRLQSNRLGRVVRRLPPRTGRASLENVLQDPTAPPCNQASRTVCVMMPLQRKRFRVRHAEWLFRALAHPISAAPPPVTKSRKMLHELMNELPRPRTAS